MRLYFEGLCNGEYPMINTITVRTHSGVELTIDREETIYSINKGNLRMEWGGICLCQIEGLCVFGNPPRLDGLDADSLLVGAEVISIEIEDEADENYEVTINRMEVRL